MERRELGVKLNAFMVVKSDITINERLCFADGLRLKRGMHSDLRIEKKFSAIALSYGFARLDIDGVMPYCVVRAK